MAPREEAKGFPTPHAARELVVAHPGHGVLPRGLYFSGDADFALDLDVLDADLEAVHVDELRVRRLGFANHLQRVEGVLVRHLCCGREYFASCFGKTAGATLFKLSE